MFHLIYRERKTFWFLTQLQQRGGWWELSESLYVSDDCLSVSFNSMSSCRALQDRLAHFCVCVCVFTCDPRQVPTSMTRFHHLQTLHISRWQLRARTLSRSHMKVCVWVRLPSCNDTWIFTDVCTNCTVCVNGAWQKISLILVWSVVLM